MANFFKGYLRGRVQRSEGQKVDRGDRSGWMRWEARKREKEFRKDGQRCVELYEQRTPGDDSRWPGLLNILYANTRRWRLRLQQHTAAAVVKRKVQGRKSTGELSLSKVLQRGLEYLTHGCGSAAVGLLRRPAEECRARGAGPRPRRWRASSTNRRSRRFRPRRKAASRLSAWTTKRSAASRFPGIAWFMATRRVGEGAVAAYEHFMTREECIANFGEEEGSRSS
jgi:hypothetical protein